MFLFFTKAPFLNINSKMRKEEVSEVTAKNTSEEDFQIVAPYDRGVTYELCAGIVDQKRSLPEIAQSEIEEETGYIVPLENIRRVYQHHGVGHSGQRVTVFYTEVTDDMKKADGGGVKDSGEFIELFYLARQEAREFALSDDYIKPSSAIAAILWYFTEFKC